MYNSLPVGVPYTPGQNFQFDPSTMGNYGMNWGASPAAINPTPIAMPETPAGPWSMEGAFGKFGWAPHAINAASGLMQGFIGMKQYGLGKRQLAENKRQFELNYAAQKKITNEQMRNRYRGLSGGVPGDTMPVDEYMAQNGI